MISSFEGLQIECIDKRWALTADGRAMYAFTRFIYPSSNAAKNVFKIFYKIEKQQPVGSLLKREPEATGNFSSEYQWKSLYEKTTHLRRWSAV